MYLSKEKIDEIIKVASENDGHCDRCLRVIQVYKYGISTMMAGIMKKMAAATRETGKRDIDMGTLGLTHNERSQLSKMRQHGIIVQTKEDGHKKARHWLITTKGWQFLRGEDIPAKVVVFDNQVLGHEGGVANIRRILGEPGFYEADPLSTEEAAAFHDVRTPQKQLEYDAVYQGNSYSDNQPKKGTAYTIYVERLQIGKPVKISCPLGDGTLFKAEYADIAAFYKSWKITK